MPREKKNGKYQGLWKKILRWTLRLVVGFIVGSVLLVGIYAVLPVPLTPLMILRVIEGAFEGRAVGISKTWVPYNEVSPYVYKALMSGEDGKFLRHNGFDWNAIDRARARNERAKGKKLYGASTITMQTAKNVFLWHGRNYIRKGLEAYFTVLIEAVWGKRRILEVYGNVIEWGDGIYGVEAASQFYFHKSARTVSASEAALLAAIVPNPRRWSASAPTPYIQKRKAFILSRMGGMPLPSSSSKTKGK